MQKGHSQYMGMTPKDNELVVHVRPIITHIVVWSRGTGLSTVKNTRQNSETPMRVRSCPKSVMEVLIHLTPLHFHMDEVAWRTQVRRLAKTFPQENGFRSTIVYLETVERLNQ